MKHLYFFIILFLTSSCASLNKFELSNSDFKSLDKESKVEYYRYEVTNEQFNLFLNDLKEKDADSYKKFMIKADMWTSIYPYPWVEAMERAYHKHPAYRHYPVVNISHEAALAYVEWLNQKTSNKKYIYRLPNNQEWDMLLSTVNIKYNDNTIPKWDNVCFNMKFSEKNYVSDGAMFTTYVARKFHNQITPEDVGKNRPTYVQNDLKMTHIIGNVSEMLENGDQVGGHWDCLPSSMSKNEVLPTPDPRVGFRLVRERVSD